MAMAGVRAAQPGFTLIELMSVMVIVVLVGALSAPAFSRLLEASRIRTEATRLMGDIVLTRSEAIKRNRQVVMCPAGLSAAGEVECGGVYAQGWIVFQDNDRDGELSGGEEIVDRGQALASDLFVTNRVATRAADEKIKFQPDGSSRRNLTLMVCSGGMPEITSWSVVMNIVGRPRLARGWGRCQRAED